jgi:hypothetical protein
MGDKMSKRFFTISIVVIILATAATIAMQELTVRALKRQNQQLEAQMWSNAMHYAKQRILHCD